MVLKGKPIKELDPVYEVDLLNYDPSLALVSVPELVALCTPEGERTAAQVFLASDALAAAQQAYDYCQQEVQLKRDRKARMEKLESIVNSLPGRDRYIFNYTISDRQRDLHLRIWQHTSNTDWWPFLVSHVDGTHLQHRRQALLYKKKAG